MKKNFLIAFAILALVLAACGSASQPAQATEVPAPTTTPQWQPPTGYLPVEGNSITELVATINGNDLYLTLSYDGASTVNINEAELQVVEGHNYLKTKIVVYEDLETTVWFNVQIEILIHQGQMYLNFELNNPDLQSG